MHVDALTMILNQFVVQHPPGIDPSEHAVRQLLKVRVQGLEAITNLSGQARHAAVYIRVLIGERDLLEERDDVLLNERTYE